MIGERVNKFTLALLLVIWSVPSLQAQTILAPPTIADPSEDAQPTSTITDLGPIEEPADKIQRCETQNAHDRADKEFGWIKAIIATSGSTVVKMFEVAREMGPFPTGLTRSRWAMDDPKYASKYANGAKKSDIAGKVKQASDARFIDGSSGWYLSGGLTSLSKSQHALASMETGHEEYWSSYLTSRTGIIAAINDNDGYIGLEGGLRLQTPTRLAPFVGTGIFAGFASQSVPADNDGVDNDHDHVIDEHNEEDTRLSGSLVGVYPEYGLHFWWTPRVRLTGYGRYLITTEGRDSDSWLYGFGVALMSGN